MRNTNGKSALYLYPWHYIKAAAHSSRVRRYTLLSLACLLAITTWGAAQAPHPPVITRSLPALSVKPANLTFGIQDLGTSSNAKTLTLVNNETTGITLLSISTDAADYTITTNCPLSPGVLAGGATCNIFVVFTPSVVGNESASLTVTDDSDYTLSVSLSGTGVVPPSVSPSSLTFAAEPVGSNSPSQLVTLMNNLPSALSISGITSSLPDYILSSACPIAPLNLAAGSSCTVSVTFSPRSPGNRSGLLRFKDNAKNSPQTVSLSGVGVPVSLQSISVTPQTPSVVVGNTLQFVATGNYNNGTLKDLTSSAKWSSSDSSVAVVSKGLATTRTLGSTTITAKVASISGSSTLNVISAAAQSRVPERICMIEAEASASIACQLQASVSAGNGMLVFVTSVSTENLTPGSVHDSAGNTYTVVEGSVSGGYGSIYTAYSLLTSALKGGDSVTLTVPGADAWALSMYNIGPVESSQPDVGVIFQNPNVGLPGVINPATGVPGWWTGVTSPTQGSRDVCVAALGVGAGGSDDGAPAPVTSYTFDGTFLPLSVSQFYSQSDPNFPSGGTLLTSYAEVSIGTSVQSHITGPNANTAPAVLYCFSEAPGTVVQTPRFTGNYCTGAATCTINSVLSGDMLVISGHTFSGLPSTPIVVDDTQAEAVIFDQINNTTGLATWHISPVTHSGSHTISVNDANDNTLAIDVMEVSGQASGNPVESAAQSSMASASLGTVQLQTSVPNDLLYGWGRASQGTDQGEGFNAIRVTPTAEYTIAPGVGPQTVTILPRPPVPATTVGDQAMAIRPAGTIAPPVVAPVFTGNYSLCQDATTCTIDNVATGDMLVLTFFWWGQPADLPLAVDNMGETLIADRNNDTDGTLDLALWHIPAIVNSGAHTLSVGNFSASGPSTLMISEYSSQSAANPIDAVTGATGSGDLAAVSINTSQGNDLIYVACVSPAATTAADNYAQLSSDPSVQFRPAAAAAASEDVSCPLVDGSSTWVIQELAIKH